MQLARLMLLVTALGVACQSSSGPPQGTQVLLTPDDTTIGMGASVQLEATLRYGAGIPMPAARVEWRSENPAVATVSSQGIVHAAGHAGVAWISATVDTLV